MRPSDITARDCDIFCLHVEVLQREARSLDYASIQSVQKSVSTSTSSILDWAIDYSKAMPKGNYAYNLIVAAHTTSSKVDGRKDKLATAIITAFYNRLYKRKILQQGNFYLSILGS